MTSYFELNKQISQAVENDDDLMPIKDIWTKNIQKLDSFIEKFIDKYGRKLMGDKDDSPEWKLYSMKTEEYHTYNRALRNLEYFIAKKKLAK